MSPLERAAKTEDQAPETSEQVEARWRDYCVIEVMIRNKHVDEFVRDKEAQIERLNGYSDAARALEKAADDHLWGKHPNTQHKLIEAIMAVRALLEEGR